MCVRWLHGINNVKIVISYSFLIRVTKIIFVSIIFTSIICIECNWNINTYRNMSLVTIWRCVRKIVKSYYWCLVCPVLRLYVRMKQLGSHSKDFHDIWHLGIFRKSVEKFQVLLKSDKNKGTYIFLSHLAQFFLEWEMFQTRVVEKIKTHIFCSMSFFSRRFIYHSTQEKIFILFGLYWKFAFSIPLR